MSKKLVTEQAFREAAKAGHVEVDTELRKAFTVEVKASSEGDRKIDFVISTDSVDRMGDTIAVDGWDLANYRANPQVLWAHDASMPPIAKGMNVRVEDGKLKATAQFVPADNPAIGAFAEGIYQLYLGGYLRAVSVGFIPIEYSFSEDDGRSFGIDFTKQELLEFSACPIPANPEALSQASAAGIDITPIREWAVKFMESDDQMSLIPKDRLTAIKALAEEFRSDAKKSAASKGASGIYRRCANRIEKALTGKDETSTQPPEPVNESASEPVEATPENSENVATGFAEIAARRLKTVRHKAS